MLYHLISVKWDWKHKWSYEENHKDPTFDMEVPLPNVTVAKIDHLTVFTAKKTLGAFLVLHGEAAGGIKVMKERAQGWVDRAKEGHLRKKDVWFLLNCQFWPKVGFGLSCNIGKLEDL